MEAFYHSDDMVLGLHVKRVYEKDWRDYGLKRCEVHRMCVVNQCVHHHLSAYKHLLEQELQHEENLLFDALRYLK